MSPLKLYQDIHGKKFHPLSYTQDIIKNNPWVKIHIGTDSQNYGDRTVYVTVIAYRFGTRGVHYIYQKENVPLIHDSWTRLWGETERTMELAEYLGDVLRGIRIQIDMDFNQDETKLSNKLVSASRGWAQSLGYKVNIKPDELVATRAADYHCT